MPLATVNSIQTCVCAPEEEAPSRVLKGRIHSFETFGLVDGPGVRFVTFLQGCAMRCRYCHNPETWSSNGEMWTPEALLQKALRYRSYWGKGGTHGGITVSGGEPLLQLEFVARVFELAHKNRVHTALDTSGQPFRTTPEYLARFDRLLEHTDLVILDLKEMDSEKHKSLTGYGNENILELAGYLAAQGIRLWLRHVLVPGLTDDEEGLREMHRFIDALRTVQRVEILPYHTLGRYKWEKLGLDYSLDEAEIPTPEQVRRAEELLGIPEHH